MDINDRKVTDTYKDKKLVHKTVRVNKETALTLDKFIDFVREVNGKNISQSKVLAGILNHFITEYNQTVQVDPDKANEMVKALVH